MRARRQKSSSPGMSFKTVAHYKNCVSQRTGAAAGAAGRIASSAACAAGVWAGARGRKLASRASWCHESTNERRQRQSIKPAGRSIDRACARRMALTSAVGARSAVGAAAGAARLAAGAGNAASTAARLCRRGRAYAQRISPHVSHSTPLTDPATYQRGRASGPAGRRRRSTPCAPSLTHRRLRRRATWLGLSRGLGLDDGWRAR